MLATARAPGTCGELVQGKIDRVNFLVTCPVDMYSVVTVQLNNSGVIQADPALSKVRTAVEKTLALLDNRGSGAVISVSSDIPHGKGMASSTADIAAACAAAGAALGVFLTPPEVAEIALSIEPTDGIMFPGIILFDHIAGRTCRFLGQAPAIEAVIVDLGGTVDTVSFNASGELDGLNRLKEQKVLAALEKMEIALSCRDLKLIGEAATESAFANQHILYKPELAILLEICIQSGGLGINIAHSGTIVGLLFDQAKPASAEIYDKLAVQGFRNTGPVAVINGGIDILCERAGDKVWQPLSTFMGETCGRLRKSTG